MLVYFVRHGESKGNANHAGGDFTMDDADQLTELGKKQAVALGKRLEREGIQRIISSPMRRARETAEGITQTLKLPVEFDDSLYEVRAPQKFYQTPIEERQPLVPHLFMSAHSDNPDYTIEDSESFNQALARAKGLMKKLEGLEEERVLVVSHADFMRFLAGIILRGEEFGPSDFVRLWNLNTINTGITVLEYGETKPFKGYPNRPWRIRTWMDHAHL